MKEQYARVYAKIDMDALHFNVDNMHHNIDSATKMIGVIKADGYGHGAIPIAKELESLDYFWGFATATFEEADILRQAGIKKPILVLGYTFPYAYEEMLQKGIRPAVFRRDTLEQLHQIGINNNTQIPIHIKVDTGMSRIGIKPNDDGLSFVSYALSLSGIKVEGMFTHFARADEEDKTNVNKQITSFQNFAERIKQELQYDIPFVHCSNSAGIVELPMANMNLVRAGITLYGLWPSEQVSQNIISLKPLLELKSHIVYIKSIEPGDAVSYGGTYKALTERKVATIPVGYGDGYPRSLSGKGYVLIHGQKAPILGRVCMDQMMVDVTDIETAKMGDKVTLIGKDGLEEITMEELGNLSGRFNYELACDLGKRIPRVYVKKDKIIATKDYYHDSNWNCLL